MKKTGCPSCLRPSCPQLRTQLQEIKPLKAEFDLKVTNIKTDRNTAPIYELEKEIREKIKFLKETLFTRCELVEITIGNKSKEELIRELKEREESNNPKDIIYIENRARKIFESSEFTVINKPEKITLIKLEFQDLGFSYSSTIDQVYQRAQEMGLELCPPEIGLHLRLNYEEVFQSRQDQWKDLYIGMKPIIGSIFILGCRDEGELVLDCDEFDPELRCGFSNEFVFTYK